MELKCNNHLEHMQVLSHIFHALWSDDDFICLSVDMTVEQNRIEHRRVGNVVTSTIISILCRPFASACCSPTP